jgi:phosphopantothenoylcysteine decarboxylase
MKKFLKFFFSKTCIARAWDFEKPFVVAPAMNTMMWNHPITNSHLNILKDWGVQCISPISKTLICGDTGIGAMEEVANIVFILKDKILAKSLK